MNSLRIALVSGAHRTGSRSALVARYLFEQLSAHSTLPLVTLIDASDPRIPLFDDRARLSEEHAGFLQSIGSVLSDSDALVLVSPEYNGGMAGSLKNLLDFYRKEYERKPMGLVSVSSGTLGGINALHQMIEFASYVGAFILNKRLMVSEVDKAFDPQGGVVSERLGRNASVFVEELMWLSEAIHHHKERTGSRI